jgi:hypothetical protein
MEVKEITPKELRCGTGMCPGVYETEDGTTLLIVGEKVASNEIPDSLLSRIGNNETVIKVPANLVRDL